MESILLGLVLIAACVLAVKAPKLFQSKEPVLTLPAQVLSRRAKAPDAALPNNWGNRMDYFVTFSTEEAPIELSVSAGQYTQLTEGTRIQLRYQGTRLLDFEPTEETEVT